METTEYRVELRNYAGLVSTQTFVEQDSALSFALLFATEGITAKLFSDTVYRPEIESEIRF
jgi:hypothetical protein